MGVVPTHDTPIGATLAGLIVTSNRGLQKDMREDIGQLRGDIKDLRGEVGELRERMAHLEGLREAISGRAAASSRGLLQCSIQQQLSFPY